MSLMTKIITTIETHLQNKKEKQAKADEIINNLNWNHMIRPELEETLQEEYDSTQQAEYKAEAERAELEEIEEYCEVCGIHYDAEDPCPFH